jgi:hypothetical protein
LVVLDMPEDSLGLILPTGLFKVHHTHVVMRPERVVLGRMVIREHQVRLQPVLSPVVLVLQEALD